MGSYHEPRVPQGSPVDNEKDVWLDHGTVKWGHWSSAAGDWVIDATASSEGLLGEKGATGDEGPPCPTGGNADTLDGYHASNLPFANSRGSWVGVVLNANNWAGSLLICKYTDGWVWVWGSVYCLATSGGATIGMIPDGYRPPTNVFGMGAYYGNEDNQGPVRLRAISTGTLSIVNYWNKTLTVNADMEIDFRYQSL